MEKTIEEILAIDPTQRTPEELEQLTNATDLTEEQKQQLADEQAQSTPPQLTAEDILAKNPEDRTKEENDFLNTAQLTDEQLAQLDEEANNPPVQETEEEKKARLLKERNKQSANENRIIRSQNTVLQERLAQVKEIPEPTEDELRDYEPEWDDLTEAEKRITRRQWKADKRAEQVHSIALQTKSDQEWNKKLDEFIDTADAKDEYPEIVSNRQEFIKFATMKQHKGVPLDLLADAFYTRQGLNNQKQKRTNLMDRAGSSGRGQQPPTKQEDKTKLTPLQVKNIRENDPKKYMQLVKSGQIVKDLSA